MELIEGTVRNYDWGSVTAIPELLGRPAAGEPWAELWFGAHPSAPALVGNGEVPLDELIAADPAGALGADVADRFGELPFLLKVLAAAVPLSLQAHPSAEQARDGYAREDQLGIPLDARHRSFRDRSHKPELICALTPFDVLCGFRDPVATIALLDTIETPALDPVRRHLRDDTTAEGIHELLRWLLTLEPGAAADLADAVIAACRSSADDAGRAERGAAAELGERHPGDAGVVTVLLMNLVTLEPAEALFLGAGNLHVYLRGMGVEIMANSDNVLRGGLTTKHVDVPALLDVVRAEPGDPIVQRPAEVEGIATYDTPVPEFSLQRAAVDGTVNLDGGPAIVLCVDGCVDIGDHSLDRGEAVWISASDSSVTVEGRATIFRAGVGPLA